MATDLQNPLTLQAHELLIALHKRQIFFANESSADVVELIERGFIRKTDQLTENTYRYSCTMSGAQYAYEWLSRQPNKLFLTSY